MLRIVVVNASTEGGGDEATEEGGAEATETALLALAFHPTTTVSTTLQDNGMGKDVEGFFGLVGRKGLLK